MSATVMIHALFWNGGLSHVITVAGEHVKIYQCQGQDSIDWEDTCVDVWLGTIEQEGHPLEFPPFLRQDTPNMEMNDVVKSQIFEGSALFHRSNGTLLFVENEVREIRLLEGDTFHVFHSDMGNAGVPYSFIKGTRYTYILTDSNDRAYPNALFEDQEYVYSVFYELEEAESTEGLPFHTQVFLS